MKTIEETLYSYSELSESAQNTVIENIAEDIQNDPDNFTLNECMDSLKAIVDAMGLRLTDWSVGPYNRNNFAYSSEPFDRYDLDGGNKTIASFVRCLVSNGYSRPKHFSDMEFPGVCGFTGVCCDEDIAETILEALMEGESFRNAVDRAADRIREICEDDLEYRTSREGILEYLDQNEEIYTEDGQTY